MKDFAPRLRIVLLLIVCLSLTSGTVEGDEVFLKNGRVLQGVVVEQNDSQVVIELAAGKMSLPRSMVERVTISSSKLGDYQQRAQALDESDVEGWLRLAFWAVDKRLDTKSQAAFGKVLEIDPDHIVAREVLGQLGPDDPSQPFTAEASLLAGVDDADFHTPWTVSSLVPASAGAEPNAAARGAVERVLSLAADCRWAEASWRLREARREHGSHLDDGQSAAVLYALEVAAHTPNRQVEALFTPEDVHFDRRSGVLFLRFEDASPLPWEFDGSVVGDGEGIDLSGAKSLDLRIPFRRSGQKRHLGTVEALDEPIRFEGRLLGAPGDAGLTMSWSTDDGSGPVSVASIRLSSDAEGRSSGEVTSVWKEDQANYRKPKELPEGFLTEPRFLRAKVENGPVSFDVEGGFTDSMNLPRSRLMFLGLEGTEGRAVLDWISLSGAVDGLWIAWRLGLQARD